MRISSERRASTVPAPLEFRWSLHGALLAPCNSAKTPQQESQETLRRKQKSDHYGLNLGPSPPGATGVDRASSLDWDSRVSLGDTSCIWRRTPAADWRPPGVVAKGGAGFGLGYRPRHSARWSPAAWRTPAASVETAALCHARTKTSRMAARLASVALPPHAHWEPQESFSSHGSVWESRHG